MSVHPHGAADDQTAAPSGRGLGQRGRQLGATVGRSQIIGIALALFLVSTAFALLSPQFLTERNLSIVLGQTAAVTIASFAMTMVILSGGIDLSVGAIVALSSVVTGLALRGGQGVVVAVVAALAVATAVGVVNGLITVRWHVQPFLVTLGTLSIGRGVAEYLADGRTIPILNREFVGVFVGNVGGVPLPAVWTVAFLVGSHLLLQHTVFGRRLYAIGGNERAAVQAGTRVGAVKVGVYTISGLLAGFASLISTARLSSGLPGAGVGFELDVIAAVVLGGTGFKGEGGSVVGTTLGALTIGVVGNGLTLLGVNPFVQRIVKGGIILAAIVLDSVRNRRAGG